MKEKLRDLSEDSRALLETGRADEVVPAELESRLWRRISNALLVPPGMQLPRAPRLVPKTPAGLSHAKTLFALKLAGVTLALAGTGAGMLLAAHHSHRSRPAMDAIVAPMPPPAISPTPSPIPSIEAQRRDQPIEHANRAAPRPMVPARLLSKAPTTATSPSLADEDLAAERSLIGQARSALQRGAPLDALTLLRTHEKQFRAGRLAEERDALRIEALEASGDRAAAEAAAAQFARTYPHGLMGPAVRATLRNEP